MGVWFSCWALSALGGGGSASPPVLGHPGLGWGLRVQQVLGDGQALQVAIPSSSPASNPGKTFLVSRVQSVSCMFQAETWKTLQLSIFKTLGEQGAGGGG